MNILNIDEFLENFGRAAKPTMNMSIYQDSYQCGCGETHWFSGYEDIICEGFQKVMLRCPEGRPFVNSLKIKTFILFKFKGFENLSSARIDSEEDLLKLQVVRSSVRGR